MPAEATAACAGCGSSYAASPPVALTEIANHPVCSECGVVQGDAATCGTCGCEYAESLPTRAAWNERRPWPKPGEPATPAQIAPTKTSGSRGVDAGSWLLLLLWIFAGAAAVAWAVPSARATATNVAIASGSLLIFIVWLAVRIANFFPPNETRRTRRGIPQNIKQQVWTRDGGYCVYCGGSENLEFDHVIPFSKGGADSVENLQVLCRSCNRRKSANI